jgi:hypothetical protein
MMIYEKKIKDKIDLKNTNPTKGKNHKILILRKENQKNKRHINNNESRRKGSNLHSGSKKNINNKSS